MRLELGNKVSCTDAEFGELADVIVDPISRRITHLVVAPHGDREGARLVGIERARPAEEGLVLDHSIAEVEALESLRESAYVRARDHVVADPDWDVGAEDVLALPLFQEMDGMGTVVDPDPHVMVRYDRIPKNEVEIRRSSAVWSSDGEHLGHVDGFLINDDRAFDIVLERGHLWGRREVVIPAAGVQQVGNDSITLSLTKQQVAELDVRHVHRWF